MLLHMKRTTLVLDAALYAALKRRAATEGRTLTDVVERALRLGLSAPSPARRPRVALPSYDLGPFLVRPGESDAARRGTVPREED
jgi:ribbon-helix-helix CopG family protein